MSFNVVVLEPQDFAIWLAHQHESAWSPMQPLAARGQELFLANGCSACHTVRGTPAEGVVGLDLTHVGSRLSLGADILPKAPEAFLRWIAHTAAVKPGVHIPTMRPLEELRALSAYLDGLQCVYKDYAMTHLPEEHESLWLLILSPVLWAVHFLLCYLTAAIWCAKLAGPDGSLGSVRVAITVYTVLALLGIGIIGWQAFRRHTFGNTTAPHDFDSPAGRHGFLGFATFLLSALSAVATLYAALAAVFIRSCA